MKEEVRQKLMEAGSEALAEWCPRCGQVLLNGVLIDSGDKRCLEDLKVGKPDDCLRAFLE